MRVRAGSKYQYNPVAMDRIDPKSDLKHGEFVRVVNLPGCPKANIMGHCHVERTDGMFAGLVCCNSLEKIKKG